MEKEKLLRILTNPVGVAVFPFEQVVLRDDLIENDYDTPEVIENIRLAKEEIMSLLIKVQREREKSTTYQATTGLEDGPLKSYLVRLVRNGKKDYPLLGERENFKDKKNESQNVFKDANEEYFLNEINGPRLLKLKKSALYYIAFDAIYSLIPDGGTITFNDFAGGAKMGIKRKLTNKDNTKKCKIIRSFLTDKSNGFLRASKIKDTTFNNKPLIECNPITGIVFNNKK
jgi:hypothetical protein